MQDKQLESRCPVGGIGITLAGSEGLVAAEVSGVLSASSRSIAGRSGVALPGRGMLGRSTLADDSPAEWGRSRSRGAIVSLTLSPSLSGFSPTLTMGADLHTRTEVLERPSARLPQSPVLLDRSVMRPCRQALTCPGLTCRCAGHGHS